jgi:hypothetical protein
MMIGTLDWFARRTSERAARGRMRAFPCGARGDASAQNEDDFGARISRIADHPETMRPMLPEQRSEGGSPVPQPPGIAKLFRA